MLVGETGVGKEVIARCIHLHSRRAAQPFIAIRCSAAVPAAVESELFGHERGAVAGAVSRKLGALERAQAGTVFLDAVEELPLSIQARLLAALRDGRFLRSGGDQPVQTSARILSASTRDLEEDARSGRFHPDLLRLLGAFPIEIPPLRERPADIDALAEQFAGAAAVKFGKPQLRLSEAARFLLRSHPWPGNVRELENVIERAAILSDGEILPAHLPHVPPQAVSPAGAASLNVHELERKAIEEALRRHGGNRTRAARELGISLRTLQYRLKEYGLSKP
jgi:DNA-binding NtrC family response regulator